MYSYLKDSFQLSQSVDCSPSFSPNFSERETVSQKLNLIWIFHKVINPQFRVSHTYSPFSLILNSFFNLFTVDSETPQSLATFRYG